MQLNIRIYDTENNFIRRMSQHEKMHTFSQTNLHCDTTNLCIVWHILNITQLAQILHFYFLINIFLLSWQYLML